MKADSPSPGSPQASEGVDSGALSRPETGDPHSRPHEPSKPLSPPPPGSTAAELKPASSRELVAVSDPSLDRLAASARAYAAAKDSANTARAYASDWRLFARWCRRRGFEAAEPHPPTVGLYLAALAAGDGMDACAVSTIDRKLSGLCAAYRAAGTPLDRQDRHIANVMAGIRRTHAKPPRQKEAVLGEDVLDMIATLPNDLRGFRDRAILLLGFAGALRRSEVVGLDCGPSETQDGDGWIEILPAGASGSAGASGQSGDGGLLLTIRGKTGWRQVEVGRGSSERTCPVAALETWLKLGRIAHGPVFRRLAQANGGVAAERLSDKHVARLVQKTAMAAGIRGDLAEGARRLAFAGHSLRAGLATAADVEEALVQKQLGHASAEMTRGYKRRRDRFRVNLTRAAGL